MGGFEPVTLYDVPGIALKQVFDGEASAESFKNLFLSPDGLSPDERDDLADQLAGSGAGRLAKTLVGVATNPWVWLMFLTSPVGAKALAAGKPFNFVAKQFSAYSKKAAGFLDTIRTDLQVFRGTAVETHTLAIQEALQQVQGAGAKEMQAGVQGLLRKFEQLGGRKGVWDEVEPLAPHRYKKGSWERQMVEEFDQLVTAKAIGLDQEVVEAVQQGKIEFDLRKGIGREGVAPDPLAPMDQGVRKARLKAGTAEARAFEKQMRDEYFSQTARQRQRAGYPDTFEEWWAQMGQEPVPIGGARTFVVPAETGTKVRARLVAGDLGHVLQQRYGEALMPYVEARGKALREGLVRYVGDDAFYAETGGFKTSDAKMRGVVGSLKRELGAKGTAGEIDAGVTTLQGKELLLQLIEMDGLKKVQGAAGVEEGIETLVKELGRVVTPDRWDDVWWTPRNTHGVQPVVVAGKRVMPPGSLNDMEKKLVDFAPWSTSHATSNRLIPLTSKEEVLDPEWLKALDKQVGLTPDGFLAVEVAEREAQEMWAKKGQALMVRRSGFDESARKYLASVNEASTMDTMPAPASALQADELYRANLPAEVAESGRFTYLAGGHKLKVGEAIPAELHGKVTLGDLLDREYMRLSSEAHQARMRNQVVPNALGAAGPEFLAIRAAEVRNKEMAAWFADGFMGRTLEKFGGDWGRKFVQEMKDYADFTNRTPLKSVGGKVASYFYLTHLGANMGSVILNMTQPLLLAGTAGSLDEVMGAWVDSFKDMARYANKRAQMGARVLNPTEKMALIEDTFQFAKWEGKNLIGIGPHVDQVLDASLSQTSRLGKMGQILMTGFEKSEWFNRNFAAHLMKRMYQRVGKPLTSGFAEDVQGFVLRTQFGQSPLNTPEVFQKGFLRNPLFRQFMAFPLRSVMGVFDEFPVIGGAESYWKGLSTVILRGMGMSAMVNEVGRGMLGADLSRGLFASSTMSLFGGERLVEKDGDVLPLPPVVRIPLDLMRGVASEDMGLLAGSVARLVPGGVALNRMLQLGPELPQVGGLAGLPGALQRTYAGWDQPLPTGEVPVYKGDGTLIEYRRPSEIVARAMGMDMGAWQQQGALDNYLVKQREEILQKRHEYMRAIASNEFGRAAAIAQDFQTKFKGVPLTVTREQVERYLGNRTASRTERALDRLPPEVRSQYAAMAQAQGAGANIRGGLAVGTSSRERDHARINAVTDAQIQEIMRRVERAGPAASPGNNQVQPFRGFGDGG